MPGKVRSVGSTWGSGAPRYRDSIKVGIAIAAILAAGKVAPVDAAPAPWDNPQPTRQECASWQAMVDTDDLAPEVVYDPAAPCMRLGFIPGVWITFDQAGIPIPSATWVPGYDPDHEIFIGSGVHALFTPPLTVGVGR